MGIVVLPAAVSVLLRDILLAFGLVGWLAYHGGIAIHDPWVLRHRMDDRREKQSDFGESVHDGLVDCLMVVSGTRIRKDARVQVRMCLKVIW